MTSPAQPDDGRGDAHGDAEAFRSIVESLTEPTHLGGTIEAALMLTELSFVERFIQLYRNKVMFVPGVGWYAYRNHVWQLDELEDVLELTKTLIPLVQAEWLDGKLIGVTQSQYESAMKSISRYSTRSAILKAAALDQRLKVHVTRLNADPWILNTENGTLDLRTGALRDGDPRDCITQQAAVKFDENAECPRFDALLRHAFPDNDEMIEYIWRVLGYCLTGVTDDQAFFFMWGVKGSSKTTIAEVMISLMGGYAQWLNEGAIVGSESQHPTWIVDLLGKRLVVKDELDGRKRINTARLNSIVSGISQRAHKMGMNEVDVPLSLKLMITTNPRPPMGDSHNGIWRRIQPMEFIHRIEADDIVVNYGAILAAEEGPGILNRCLAGLRDYLGANPEGALRLRPPAFVTAGVEEYRDMEDEHGAFITDCLEYTGDEDDWIANPDLQLVYTTWCGENNVRPLSSIALGKLLTAAHFKKSTPRRAVNVATNKRQAQRGFTKLRLTVTEGSFERLISWQAVTD